MRTRGALAIAAGTGAACAVAAWFVLWTPGPGTCAPIADDEPALALRLRAHVDRLAGAIGPRPSDDDVALAAAAEYVAGELARSRWRVRRQEVGPTRAHVNVVADTAPRDAGDRLLVIGAHYDSVAGSPGADDDASGVAALLEIARLLGPAQAGVRLVAFTNEEAPLGRGESRGSLVAARESRAAGEPLLGMLSLEMLGYYTDAPGSQRHPAPVGVFFPDVGSYLAWIANPASRGLLHETIAAFRAATPLPAEGIAVPERLVPHVRRSDHASYWDQGYPALLVTDTAEFRNPHYHRESDRPETLDYRRLAQATLGVASAARCLVAAAR
jgi:hypothetical protein